jgi:hypothetical protein
MSNSSDNTQNSDNKIIDVTSVAAVEPTRVRSVFILKKINVFFPFGLTEFKQTVYETQIDCASDLSMLLRFVDDANLFIFKRYDALRKCYTIDFKKKGDVRDMLTFNFIIKRQVVTAWEVYVSFASRFSIVGCGFGKIVEDRMFNLFRGWHYKSVECKKTIIDPFLVFLLEIICNKDMIKYNYILNWVANIAQNAGKLNKTCLVIIGQQGSGKNLFAEAVANTFKGYSVKTSNLDLVTGTNNEFFFL